MNITFNPLNLKKYLPFFQNSAECVSALGLFGHDGCLNKLGYEGDPDEFEQLIKHLENQVFNNNDPSIPNQNFMDYGSIGTVAIVDLRFSDIEKPYWLAGLLKPPAHPIDSAQRSKTINTLMNIADCIVDDYTLQLTLTGMADELTVRYEELNLIYGLDDPESFYNPVNEQQALSHLLKNCTDYINVDLAVFFAPELDLSLHKLNTAGPDFDLDSALQTVQKSLYRYIVSTEKTLVINQNRDIDWTDANLNASIKILASPVKLAKHHVGGILVLINSPHKPDFSNSDRKLCDVLASETAKLVQARRDNITGLLNRRGFTEKLQQILALLKTRPEKYSLLCIDIDQFKLINDTSGQKAGDQLLNHVSSLIINGLSNNCVVGRLGADEFGIVLENCDIKDAAQTATHLSQIINQLRFAYQGKLYDISVCIGVVELLPGTDDFSVPLASADLACNVAKEQGRNRVHIYHPSDTDMIRHENQMHWVSRINLALEQNRFKIYRQKIQLLTAEPETEEHYEILLRLVDENNTIVSPHNFIPAAERYNLMSQLDRWVVKNALKKMAGVRQRETESKLSCSINLSGQSFCEPGFVDFVIQEITVSGVPPRQICFEITETAAVSNLSQSVKFMETLKSIGCRFSLDDFGSGMSSFTYLKNLPVDYLKIDGYFVRTMISNVVDYAMVKSINEIGHVMGLKTIAEFVEDAQIKQELTRMQIDYGQGHYFGKPEPFE